MTTNIQTSVLVPLDQVIDICGSYIYLQGFNSRSYELSQELGKFKHSDSYSKFTDLSAAETYLKANYTEAFEETRAELKSLTVGFSNVLKQQLMKLGYFKKLQIKIEKLRTLRNKYENLLVNPMEHTPMKKLAAEIEMPKYSLSSKSYYYYPIFSNNKMIIRRVAVMETIVEKNYFASGPDYFFDYLLVDVDNPSVKLNYSFRNISDFDGVKWGVFLGKSMLFISEEEAKKSVAEYYQSLINQMA